MRLFVGAFPPAGVVSHLRTRLIDVRAHQVSAGIRLTRAERWHITLRFLGEVPDDEVSGVTRVLDGVPRPEKISLRLAGGGAFGRGRSAVLWAGVDGDVRPLTDLHDAIARAFGAEPVAFTPHLTMAYGESREIRTALDGYVGPDWTVDEVVLVRSHHASGGGYERLSGWPLPRG